MRRNVHGYLLQEQTYRTRYNVYRRPASCYTLYMYYARQKLWDGFAIGVRVSLL